MSRAFSSSLTSLRAAAFIAAATLSCACANATPVDEAERARLVQERAAIEAQYTNRHGECTQRFVVTSCVEDTKRDRRHALDGLRARQIVLDESRRKERSAARSSELSNNAAELARREAVRASKPAVPASGPSDGHDQATAGPTTAHRPIAEHVAAPKRHAVGDLRESAAKSASAPDRSAKEVRSRATFEARNHEAAEHREDVVDKAAKRAQQHKPAAPLPIPSP